MIYKKKILVFSGSRADYGLLKPVILKLKEKFHTIVCCGPQHFSAKFDYTFKEINKDKIKINSKIKCNINKTNIKEIIQIISTSLIKIDKELDRLKPDLVLVLGDRYEVFSIVLCSYLKNIKLAHIHGGEVTEGAFDEGLRHAITKMSNLHFVSHINHKRNVIQLGEEPKTVFNVGAIGAENAYKLKSYYKKKIKKKNDYVLITLHPETKNIKKDIKILKNIFKLIEKNKKYKFFFTNSNTDTGGSTINNLINKYCKLNYNNSENLRSLGHVEFIKKMLNAKLLIGNSSSSIIEGSTLTIPAINIGSRQRGRLTSNNIIHSDYKYSSIERAFNNALKLKKKKIKKIFLKKNTVLNICRYLEKYLKKNNSNYKKFYEIKR